MATTPDSTKSAVVDSELHYLPIDANTPRGKKMVLIRRDAGVAQIASLSTTDTFYTHWFPLPTFNNADE